MEKIIRKSFSEFNESENSLCETLFHNANGYIGVRGSLEEGVPEKFHTMRGMYINGFYDVIPMKQAENLCNFVDEKDTMLNVCDTMSIELCFAGEQFDLSEGTIISYTRELDMEKGITSRHVVWKSPLGKTVGIDITRMTSFEKLSLFLMEVKVTAIDFAGEVQVRSGHDADVRNFCDPADPRLAAESLCNLVVEEMSVSGDESCAVSRTAQSDLRMCSLVYNKCLVQDNDLVSINSAETLVDIKPGKAVYKADLSMKKGASFVLEKYTIISDSLRCDDVVKKAKDDLREVLTHGSAYYYAAQKEYLDRFWKQSEMDVYGDTSMNMAVAFNMYALLQSAAKDDKCSIAAKGLSGEGYEGHYFWDTEIFVLPFLVLTNPELAKRVLAYRYQTLDRARENAALLGHKKGALYPWRTIAGKECSGYFVSGTAAYHINADIAYAVVNYYLTTGDTDFIVNMGEEILLETARLWMDLGCYNADGDFVINAVTGPDEYTCMVNNNYYTNCAAQYNMHWAVKLYKQLKECGRLTGKESFAASDEELFYMQQAADAMLLVYDEKLGINPQDDSFLSKPVWDLKQTPASDFPLLLHYHPLHLYRYQVCKQADTVLSYFMFEDKQSRDVMRRSYEYYEKITTHDSSLSTCVFSIVAARLGMLDKAYAYFGDSAKLDLENTHNNTKDGIHTANMGGCYMAIVNGFAGLRINENGIFIAPGIPKEWEGYRFNVMYHGSLIQISADNSGVCVELLEGDAIKIGVYDGIYSLDSKINVKLR